ncbi:MAG TPA: transcriptional regulator [Actinomycetes bacterium]|nr:transcriptional regulator [Actinomycetes bacterium]
MREPAAGVASRRRQGTAAQLAVALRTGPFEHALRLAIRSRGLTLDRLRVRLLERGVHTSLASLSNWQRGRCRPERTRSLRAVRELEDILGLPGDSLVVLLGPRRPRGRRLAKPQVTVTAQAIDAVRVRLIVETASGQTVFDHDLR